jgi:hypothetical protein
LFLGGRSGVGKTSVGYEIHAQLSDAGVRHCLINGDTLDMAWPPPQHHGLAEQNLAAMWAKYTALGYRRLIYINTASVLAEVTSRLTAAMGDNPQVTAILLTCSDTTAHQRLAGREKGTELARHIERSDLTARELDQQVPRGVHRLATDNRTIPGLAAEVISLASWPHDQTPP